MDSFKKNCNSSTDSSPEGNRRLSEEHRKEENTLLDTGVTALTKPQLRKQIRALKSAYSKTELAALSAAAIRSLTESESWKNARTVLLYHSLPDEVDTHDLIRNAAASGKRVLLPVVVGDDLELRIYANDSDLALGAFNILEPTGEVFTDLSTIDLAVIPGVAFTPDGRRLGRGRGYYDRLLSRIAPSTLLVGLCWPFQLVPEIPTAPHDISVNIVITG